MTFSRIIFSILLLFGINLHAQIPDNLQNSLWEQEGYDRVLKINTTTYSYFNADDYSCSVLVKGNFNGRFEILDFSKNRLILNPGGIVNYRFKKIDSLPKNCSEENKFDDSFESNFKAFWETFKDNYAFFEKRNFEWEKVYEKYLPIVEKLKSKEEFALFLKEIVEELDDGHIRLDFPDSILTKEETSGTVDKLISKEQVLSDITGNYLESSTSYNNGIIRWGILKNRKLGYIAITDMNNFADYVPEDFQKTSEFDSIFDEKKNQVRPLKYFQDEVEGADQILRKVLDNLSETKSVIVDLRFNGGGFETVALELLRHFTQTEKKIISIKAKTKNGFTPTQNYTLKPASKGAKKIYLLISPSTASAAEIFALGSLAFPHFERYGSKSAGIFSEILWKELPIGWEYSLSNEVYLDCNNKSYESEGIPVDHNFNYPKGQAEFYKSFYSNDSFSDIAIEKIIESHSKK